MPLPALVTGALSIASFVNNYLGNDQALRDQRQAYQRYLQAVKQDQARWDERYGPILDQMTKFLSGTETAAEALTRERAERKASGSAFNQIAGGIASDFEAAKSSAEASIAGAGLNTSGAVATTQARLGEAAIKAGAEGRMAALDQGRQSRFNLLALGGPRPSTTQALAADPRLTMSNRLELDAEPLLSGARSIFEGFARRQPATTGPATSSRLQTGLRFGNYAVR